MSKPTVQEFVGGYLFTWAEADLAIKVSRLRLHSSDGRVSGELLISTAKNQQPIFPQTSFNFTSERTRGSLVKTLTELDSTHQWGDIFNQLCLIVVEQARMGEPVQELWTSADVAPPEFLLKPILYKGLPTIIFGEKAVCKSTLALAAYACLILPWHDNPLGWVAPPRPIVSLLADYEVDADVAHPSAKKLQEGMGLSPFPLFYRRCALPLADDIEQLQNHMANIGAEVIIVDSLAPAVGGDLKDAGQAVRFTSALRQLKCAALIIGQTSKSSEEKKKSVFGSTMFEYFARNIFELRKVQEEDEESFDIALFNTYHNLGKRYKPQGFHLNFNGTGTHIEKGDITARELIARIGPQAQISNLLKHQPRTIQEIALELEMTEGSVRTNLSRMKEKGKVIKVENKFGLVTQQELR